MDGGFAHLPGQISLADWRRRVAEAYAHVRDTDDAEAAWHHWRGVRDDLFRDHRQSPIPIDARAAFDGIPYFDYDPTLRFAVELEPIDDDTPRTWMLEADGEVEAEPVARTIGLGDTLGAELTVYWFTGYGGGLFVPFADATSGDETFAAGRYVLENVGLTEYEAHEMEMAFYRHDRQVLRELAELWKPGTPLAENNAYVERARELNNTLETALATQLDAAEAPLEDDEEEDEEDHASPAATPASSKVAMPE